MAQSKTKRGMSFTGQLTVYDLPAVADKEIVSLSNTKPAIANALAHGLNTGDAIWVESESNEAINGYYLVDKSNEDTFALIGLDGTDIGTVTDAKFATMEAHLFCDVTSMKVSPLKTKTSDVTTICDAAPVTEVDKEAGSMSLSALWVPDKPVQDLIDELSAELETIFFKYSPKQSSQIFGYQVKITSLDQDGKSGEKWQLSIEATINGTIRKLNTNSKQNINSKQNTRRGVK